MRSGVRIYSFDDKYIVLHRARRVFAIESFSGATEGF